MITLAKTPLALAISMLLTAPAMATNMDADKTATANAEREVEVMTVSGKKLSYANNLVDENDKLLKSPIGNVMDLVNNLPGVNVGQGDPYGADDYTTVVNMRGFVIDRADQQIGITIDGLPNGGSAYAGGSKANRYLDSENTAMVEVGQGAADIASASLDALGGTLNFISANPEEEQGGRFAHSQGSFNARRDFIRFDTGRIFENTTAYASLSNSFNNRWIGSGSNGFADRLHGELKSVTELDKVKITARLSYDDTEEDNYQPVSLAQFQNTPEWDGLTWTWTGDPDIDQNYAETWSTLRENTLLYVKTEWSLSDDLELVVTPYLHQQEGRGDWLPPYMHYPVDANGNVVKAGNVKTTRYKFVDAQGRPILDPTASTVGAKRVASYRHTHYDKDRSGALAELKYSMDNHQLRGGLWFEQQDRRQTRDWHQVIDTAISYQFNQTPYWVQFDDQYSSDVLKYFVQDVWTLGDAQITVGLQQYLVDVKRQDFLNGRGNDTLDSDSEVITKCRFGLPNF
ncbi:MAG: TonB-dependent receptor plug domain-containing protein [Rheinheimera sp.]|nr:TonB-dependent receptor plug domain-containing protein [Rheinheimera sp.]